jgi:hypothetical protein
MGKSSCLWCVEPKNCKTRNRQLKLIGANERVLNGALFELGKGCTHSFAPSLPAGSNEAGKR